MPTLKPIGDRVVIKPDEAEQKTRGGILLPSAAQEKPKKGTVVAVGLGRFVPGTGEFIPSEMKVGDRVVISWENTTVKCGEDEFWICREDGVLAVEEG